VSRVARGAPGAAALLLALSVFCGVVAAVGGRWYVERDFQCFWAAGALVATGGDPYDAMQYQRKLVESRRERLDAEFCGERFAYPPWTAAALVGLGALPQPVAAAAWLSLMVAATVLAIGWLWQLGGARVPLPFIAALVVLTEPFMLALAEGQFGVFTVALTAGAVVALRSADGRASGLATAALVVKPHIVLVVFPALLLLQLRARRWASLATVFAVAVGTAVAIAALRPSWFSEWIASATKTRAATVPLATSWDLAASLGGAPLAIGMIAALLIAIAALTRGRTLADTDVIGLGSALSLVAAPYAWTHDFVVLALPWSMTLAHATRMPATQRRFLTFGTVIVAAPLLWVFAAFASLRGGESISALAPMISGLLLALSIRWDTASATIRKTPEVT